MNQCNLCQKKIFPQFLLGDLLSWKPLFDLTICQKCLANFEQINAKKACAQCGRSQTNNRFCLDCQRWRIKCHEDVIINRSLFVYNQAMHDYFHNFKMIGDYRLRLVFKQMISDFLRNKHYDSYIFIPTSLAHFKERRFDPVVALYGDLIKPTVKVQYVGDSIEQSQKNRWERLKRSQNFSLSFSAIKKLKKVKRILFFDDIYTTGATLYSLRETLRNLSITAELFSFTLAR